MLENSFEKFRELVLCDAHLQQILREPVRDDAFIETVPMMDWCWLGDLRFTDPFFDRTIARALRLPFSLLFRQQTPLTRWNLPLFRPAFPDVPWIFIYREPVEILASHQPQPGGQMVPGTWSLYVQDDVAGGGGSIDVRQHRNQPE